MIHSFLDDDIAQIEIQKKKLMNHSFKFEHEKNILCILTYILGREEICFMPIPLSRVFFSHLDNSAYRLI